MRKRLLLGLLVVVLIAAIVPVASAQRPTQDVIYLKDGSVVRGRIIEQVPNVSVKIKTREGNIFVYKMVDIQKITKETAMGVGSYGLQEKSPAVAFLLSFLIPGLGQYYNGDYAKGAIQDGLLIAGYVMVFALGWEDVQYQDYWYDYYYDQYYYNYYWETEITTWFWVGLATISATSLWSMIDAPLSAININKKLSQGQYGHAIEYDSDNYALGFDIGPVKKSLGATITLHF